MAEKRTVARRLKHSITHRGLWILLLLLAAGLRFVAPDWDGAIAAHPDERYLIGVAQDVPLYHNVCRIEADFPYGHLPLTLAQLLVMAAPQADPLYAARLLSGLIGVALVAVTGIAARALGGRWAALLALAVAALSPFLIQQSHFYTVDPLAAALAVGAVVAAGRRRWVLAGLLVGLSVASKASLMVGAMPLLIAALWVDRHSSTSPPKPRSALRLSVAAIAAFIVASPWSLLTPVACWRGPLIQGLMASGRFEFPYTQQYTSTLPYVYPLVQMGLWGLGPVATGLGLVGLGRATVRRLRKPLSADLHGLAWLWTLCYFVLVGGLQVKFPRYMLPLYPWWIAWAIDGCLGWKLSWRSRDCRLVVPQMGMGLLLLLVTGAMGIAQVGLYGAAHPWETASEWMYARWPSGTVLAIEAWDHPLPVPIRSTDVQAFFQLQVPIFDPDGPTKVAQLEAATVEAEAVVLASRRGYGSLSRQPERYALTLGWYRDILASGTVVAFARCPRLGPLAITDDPVSDAAVADAALPVVPSLAQRCGTRYAVRLPRLDESFRVYDAPMVLVLLHPDVWEAPLD